MQNPGAVRRLTSWLTFAVKVIAVFRIVTIAATNRYVFLTNVLRPSTSAKHSTAFLTQTTNGWNQPST